METEHSRTHAIHSPSECATKHACWWWCSLSTPHTVATECEVVGPLAAICIAVSCVMWWCAAEQNTKC